MAAFKPITRQAIVISGADGPAATGAAVAKHAWFSPRPRNGDPVSPRSWSERNTQEALW